MTWSVTLVVPSIGRPGLQHLLDSLSATRGPRPERVLVVDDSPDGRIHDDLGRDGLPPVTVLRSGGRGPAAARNTGWREARTRWVCFLDDDVVVTSDWAEHLAADLARAEEQGAVATQAVLVVPLPADRPADDDERGTAALASSRWITADMAYRRDVLARVGGFDERFRRAYREDSDLALRVIDAGGRIVRGTRRTVHPPASGGWWASVRRQRGNADDQLMRRLHGRVWRLRARAPQGRLPKHAATTGAGLVSLGLLAAGRPRMAAATAAGWLLGTAEFSAARINPGPREAREVLRMVTTSAAIPPVACWWTVRGWWQHRSAGPWAPELVLFDRDGTLIENVPGITDPDHVVPRPGAAEAVDRARRAGLRVGIATNQAAVGRGETTLEELERVNARVEELLGPFDTWQVCHHAPEAGCECRKPQPGMVTEACRQLGVPPRACVLVGDTAGDVAAAEAAGARGVLVPNGETRPEEVEDALLVAEDPDAAVRLVLPGSEVRR